VWPVVRFLWHATRGSRLRPWRSPYLRWRFETYTGKWAGDVVLGDFLRLVSTEGRQLLRFLAWVGEMEDYVAVKKSAARF
jgi:hypothetical protein